jgi:o-succinylbenzoate synthase
MSFRFQHHTLFFKTPAKTSRDVMTEREVYYLIARSSDNDVVGMGECAPIWGLSPEAKPELERTIANWSSLLGNPESMAATMAQFSSLKFSLECALRDLVNGGRLMPFEADLSKPVPINGLVWMSDARSMLQECRQKVEEGFTTIKFKVGALDFEEEIQLLRQVRSEFHLNDLEIRLDANGAFSSQEALKKLDRLSAHRIHSIEQPIKAGMADEMAQLVEKTPIAIALDEELIGIHTPLEKESLLDAIKPHYLILKPTLHGAFSGCDEWIELAEKRKIGWWATSALESNIGLNAITQWIMTKNVSMPQGLGTGSLFSNNIPSPWVAKAGYLRFDSDLQWNLKQLLK